MDFQLSRCLLLTLSRSALFSPSLSSSLPLSLTIKQLLFSSVTRISLSAVNRPGSRYAAKNGFARQDSADGYPPPFPRRPGSSNNMGVRRRIHSNNLRYTVRDAIELAKGRGIPISTPQGYGGDGGRSGYGGRGRGYDAFRSGGAMDRVFSRRVKMFADFAASQGRHYGTDIEDI